jgi:hypothetical protein
MDNELTQEELAAKVLQLTIELQATEKRKKDVVAGYNDELKRLKAEIKELITGDDKEDEEADL